MRVGILDLGTSPPDLMQGLPTFGQELRAWVARAVPEARLDLIDIVGGAALPEPGAHDGYVLSGSELGVYDDVAWMAPLRGFLTAARGAETPLVGICFGHQIMADVFGGRAEKIGPPHVGVRAFRMQGDVAPAHVWHQDQVTALPPGADVIAEAEYCPFGGLAYDFPAISVQFHPEYRAGFLSTFLERCRGGILPEETADQALSEIAAHSVDQDLFCAAAARVLRGGAPDLTQVKARQGAV